MNTQTQDRATARSWNYIVGRSLIHIETDACCNPAGEHIASVPKNKEANAALIVRAVNEHAALVAVAEAAQYATCESCNHNRCQGIRYTLANLEAVRNGGGK